VTAASGSEDAAALGARLIAGLTAEAEAEAKTKAALAAGFPPGRPALTSVQRAVWLAEAVDGVTGAFTLARAWDIAGPLDIPALGRAVAALVARQAALRLRVAVRDGEPVPVFDPPAPAPLQIEPPPADAADPEAWVQGRLRALGAGRLPLDRPVSRFHLFPLAPGRAVLAVALHHIAGDDLSLARIAEDLAALYAAGTGQAPPPPDLPVAYDAWLARQALRPVPPRPRVEPDPMPWPPPAAPPVAEPAAAALGRIHCAHLPAATLATLRHLGRSAAVTTFALCTAVYQAVLAAHAGTSALTVGVAFDTRDGPATASLIGLFVDYAGLPADLTGDPTLVEMAAAVQAQLAAVRAGLGGAVMPVGSATIVRYALSDLDLPLPGLSAPRRTLMERSWPSDLHLALRDQDGGLLMEWNGRHGLFPAARLEVLAAATLRALTALAADPGLRPSGLDLAGPALRAQVAAAAVAPPPPGAEDTVPARLAALAARQSGAPALATPAGPVSYAALAAETGALAGWLAARGVRPGDPVALVLPRGENYARGLLGVMAAGAVAVPVDPDYPDARLADMLAAAGVRAALAVDPAQVARLARLTGAGAFVAPLPPKDSLAPAAPPLPQDPGAPAAILFTSGSTGRPKGAITPHRSVLRLALGAFPLPPGPGDLIPQLASPGFDGAFIELWGALMTGAALLCPGRAPASVADYAALLGPGGATGAFLTTGLFNLLVDEAPGALTGLRWLAVGGEPLSMPHARRALARTPSLQLWNGYGPTENGAFTTLWPVVPDPALRRAPIGRPLPGNAAFVLGPGGQPLPPGFAGELWVGGAGLAQGYAGDPARSADRFRRFDPAALGLPAGPPLTLYGTGDRALWREDLSALDCLGRIDAQVKLNGYRIEPAEIEAAIEAQPEVARAAVWARHDGPGGAASALVAAYQPQDPARDPGPETLRRALSATLPRFLMPGRIVARDRLPLTANGKIDRRALAATLAAEEAAAAADEAAEGLTPGLAALWQDLLGGPLPGPQADFLALGGQSLAALRMLSRLEAMTGQRIPLAAFLRDPRLGALDAALKGQGASRPEPGLRLLHPGTPGGRPLYCLPGLMGHALWAWAPAQHLGGAAGPVWGVTLGALADPASRPATLAALADRLLDTILAAHDGPVAAGIDLAGYSMAGFVAWAVAERLEARGLPPGRLVLIDPNTNLAPRIYRLPPADDPVEAWLVALREAHRLGPLATRVDFVGSTEDFPLPPAHDPAEWAILAGGGVAVHPIATQHHALVAARWAPVLGARLAAILAGTAAPAAVLHDPWPQADRDAAAAAAAAAQAGDTTGALRLLDGLARRRGGLPDFLRRYRWRLAAAAGRRGLLRLGALWALAGRGPPDDPVTLTLAAACHRTGLPGLARRLWLRRLGASLARGGDQGAFMAMAALLADGRVARARRLARQLEALPRPGVDGCLALALAARALGRPDVLDLRLRQALTDSTVNLGHLRTLLLNVLRPGDADHAARALAVAEQLLPGQPIVAEVAGHWAARQARNVP
jgi:amino acid adenylation domain-containing protein